MGKKLLSILLTLAMLLSMIPAGFAEDIEIVDEPEGADAPGGPLDEIVIDEPAEADVPLAEGDVVASGQCGENLTWTLDEQGTLTISGTGDMWSYYGPIGYHPAPWFAYAESIKTLVIENGVTHIGCWAFAYCSALTSVTIPDSVTSIDGSAFKNCSALTSIMIPDSVTNIDGTPFPCCSNLKEIIVDESNQNYESLDGVLFSKDGTRLLCCPGGKSGAYVIPYGVTELGWNSFEGCSALTSVTIPDGVTSIGISTFVACSSLVSVTIGSGVTSIFFDVFTGCASLEEFIVSEENQKYQSVDGILFTKDGSGLAFYPAAKAGSVYVIPDGITEIGYYAFSGCSQLESISIPDSVTNIGIRAFSGCSGLTSMTLPAALTQIEQGAFADCSNLEEIRVAEENTSFKSEDGILFSADGSKLICYPSAYPAAEYVIPDRVTSIESMAFSGCRNLISVTVPDRVGALDGSFSGCRSLQRFSFSDSISFIEFYTFDGCDSLRDVYFDGYEETAAHYKGNGWHPVRNDAFFNATWHYGKTLEEGWELCGDNLFFQLDEASGTLSIKGSGPMWDNDLPWQDYKSALRAVNMESGVTSIGRNAFEGCSALASVTIPEGVTSIGYYAFNGCTSLASITFPESVTSIGNALYNCSGLQSIRFRGNAPSIGNYCFYGVTATAYYPEDDTTWTEDVRQNYGGRIIWFAYATASGKCGDDLTWTLDEQGTLTISGTGDMWDYNWNDSAPWYEYRSSIATLVIEEGVTSISRFAFINCGSLTNVTLPESLLSIGWRAFSSCRALTSVTIPASVTSIGDSAFMFCSSLEEIVVAEGNQYYQSLDGVLLTKDGSALICCPARKTGEYEVPAGVETIENWAFDECSGLTAITLPDSLRHINWGAFYGCRRISEITLPEGLLSIDDDSFSGMNLHEITFPASLQELWGDSGDAVFADTPIENIYVAEDSPTFCSVGGVMFSKDQSELVMFPTGRTGSYTVPEGVTSLGMKAFDGVKLTEVILPDSLTEIGSSAFQFAWDLSSLTIPANVTSLGIGALQLSGLTEIRFEGPAPSFGEAVFTNLTATAFYPKNDPSWTEDVMQNYGGTITWVPYMPEPTIIASGECGESLTWTMDDQGTLTITGTGDMWNYSSGNKAGWYSYRDSIVTVVIEEGATSIGAYAFNICTVMTSITIPDGVTSIGVYAFSDCNSLTSITIPEGVTSLGNGVFRACGRLTSVTIPGSVTSIGDYAFGINSSLIDIFVAEDNPCYQSIDGVLFDKDGTHLLVFPGGRSGAYTIPDGVESIDGFSWCTKLTRVTVPASVTNVESGAFTQCSGLKTIYFEGPAPKFGSYSFSGVTATAYYPENDPSWTEDVRQNYGGTITWEPYTPEPDLDEITEDYTKGTATVSYVETLGSGETVFTVSSEGDKAVVVAVKRGDSYTLLPCTTDKNGVHHYTADLDEDTEIVIALKGDANLDGKVTTTDGTMIKRAAMGTYSYDSELKTLVSDVNGDGNVRTTEGTMISRAAMGTYKLPW